MPTLDLASVTTKTFLPCVGQVFEAVFTDGRLPLILDEVRPLGSPWPEASRSPFSLTFRCASKLRFPQRVYRLEHPALGALDIFLVQVSGGAEDSKLEAVFN